VLRRRRQCHGRLARVSEEGLRLTESIGHVRGTAYFHEQWGYACQGLGRHDQAVSRLERAAELFKRRGPWRSLADVELATAEWVDWFNAKRLHSSIGDIPPNEHEATYYAQHQPHEVVGVNS
jgi:transposase InsO family protein